MDISEMGSLSLFHFLAMDYISQPKSFSITIDFFGFQLGPCRYARNLNGEGGVCVVDVLTALLHEPTSQRIKSIKRRMFAFMQEIDPRKEVFIIFQVKNISYFTLPCLLLWLSQKEVFLQFPYLLSSWRKVAAISFDGVFNDSCSTENPFGFFLIFF
jgi:hypothetical protein